MPDPISHKELLGLFDLPPRRIVAFFRAKGYKFSFDWREVWADEHARAFTVAKAMTDNVLGILREGVDNAIVGGWSIQRFVQELTPRLQKAGWWGRQQGINPRTGALQEVQLGSPWRLKTIYRTNHSSAFNRGRYQTQFRSRQRRPIWQYDARNDSLTRDTHRAMDNRIYTADDPIWNSIYPPNGFNCRCIVRALTPEQAEARGFKLTEPAPIPLTDFPDEGFNLNPGKESAAAFKTRITAP